MVDCGVVWLIYRFVCDLALLCLVFVDLCVDCWWCCDAVCLGFGQFVFGFSLVGLR